MEILHFQEKVSFWWYVFSSSSKSTIAVDIVISEQYFSFSTELQSLIKDMKFTNSKKTLPFYNYL